MKVMVWLEFYLANDFREQILKKGTNGEMKKEWNIENSLHWNQTFKNDWFVFIAYQPL